MRISDWSSDVCSSDLWPELLLDGNPDVAYPARLNCACALVDDLVERGQGERIALRWREGTQRRSMSYRELMALTNRIAHVLVQDMRSEEHTSELQSLMRISYAVFCLKKKKKIKPQSTSRDENTMKSRS